MLILSFPIVSTLFYFDGRGCRNRTHVSSFGDYYSAFELNPLFNYFSIKLILLIEVGKLVLLLKLINTALN